eukprot:TRINITY_DN3450_c0_g2_i1.p1 TRINITY_DN3450_c0_g2~~TRINITY_DN3450_c0_g2_i1.p1  ORF type:complete len:749 (-),score=127.71 TRINITY_DN3450_c0_g2_i1:144-2390(-)
MEGDRESTDEDVDWRECEEATTRGHMGSSVIIGLPAEAAESWRTGGADGGGLGSPHEDDTAGDLDVPFDAPAIIFEPRSRRHQSKDSGGHVFEDGVASALAPTSSPSEQLARVPSAGGSDTAQRRFWVMPPTEEEAESSPTRSYAGAETLSAEPSSRCRSDNSAADTVGDNAAQLPMTPPGQVFRSSQKLHVTIVHAAGFRHLSRTGDAPWCRCEVRHADQRESPSRCETRALPETLDPVWNETHELDSWCVGEALEFTLFDKGPLGSKLEGKALVQSHQFYPHGFEGDLFINGMEHATLFVRIFAVNMLQDMDMGSFNAASGGLSGASAASAASEPAPVGSSRVSASGTDAAVLRRRSRDRPANAGGGNAAESAAFVHLGRRARPHSAHGRSSTPGGMHSAGGCGGGGGGGASTMRSRSGTPSTGGTGVHGRSRHGSHLTPGRSSSVARGRGDSVSPAPGGTAVRGYMAAATSCRVATTDDGDELGKASSRHGCNSARRTMSSERRNGDNRLRAALARVATLEAENSELRAELEATRNDLFAVHQDLRMISEALCLRDPAVFHGACGGDTPVGSGSVAGSGDASVASNNLSSASTDAATALAFRNTRLEAEYTSECGEALQYGRQAEVCELSVQNFHSAVEKDEIEHLFTEVHVPDGHFGQPWPSPGQEAISPGPATTDPGIGGLSSGGGGCGVPAVGFRQSRGGGCGSQGSLLSAGMSESRRGGIDPLTRSMDNSGCAGGSAGGLT